MKTQVMQFLANFRNSKPLWAKSSARKRGKMKTSSRQFQLSVTGICGDNVEITLIFLHQQFDKFLIEGICDHMKWQH